MVGGGPMLAGRLDGRTIDLNSVFEAVGRVQAGTLDEAGLKAIECGACPTCGSCSGLFTANSMNCLAEVIGMALPGNGTIPAPYSERLRFAKESGEQVMKVLAAGLKPRDILTDAAVGNALAADASLGCSTNTVLHLAAIATEAGLEFSLPAVNEVAARVPHICKIAPAGEHHMEDLYDAGGIQAVMKRLIDAGLMDGTARSVAGGTSAKPSPPPASPTTRSSARSSGPITPPAASPCCSATWRRPAPWSRRARSPTRCCVTAAPPRCSTRGRRGGGHRRRRDPLGLGDRHPQRGPQGRSGHARDARGHLHARRPGPRQGRGADHRRTLQRRHAGRRHRPCRPRSAGRRAIGLVEDGDTIVVDIPARTLTLDVEVAVLERRRAAQPAAPPRPELTGWLARYVKLVSGAEKGAVLR